jgi:predicted MFS family arabinose efflux permease
MPINPLATYAEVLRLPGTFAFTTAGFFARLPLATVGLGLILFISNDTGSYAFAGFLQALFAITSAVMALFSSRLADRLGQRALLIPLPFIYTSALIIFVYAVNADWSRLIQSALVIIAGATFPSFGSFVRARWAFATRSNPKLLRPAFALESILDELIFTIGPLLAVTLAFNVGFPAPIIFGGVLTLLGALALATLHSSAPPAEPTRTFTQQQKSAFRYEGVIRLVAATTGIGILFGSFDVAVVAFTANKGTPELAGLTLSLWAFGSMIGGILFGSRHLHMPLHNQLLYTSLGMTVIALPIPFLSSTPILILVAFLSGFAIAPTLISAFSLSERLVPPNLLTEGLTWTNSGLALGFAFGASFSGFLVDQFGIAWAFSLGVAGAALTLVISMISQQQWQRGSAGRPLPAPAAALNPDPIPGPGPGGFIDDPDHNSI